MSKLLSEEKIAEISVDLAARHIVSDIDFARAIEAAVLKESARKRLEAQGITCFTGNEPCVCAPVVQPDCNTCTHRGRINGLSQETYCEQCKWNSGVDHYAAAEGKK